VKGFTQIRNEALRQMQKEFRKEIGKMPDVRVYV